MLWLTSCHRQYNMGPQGSALKQRRHDDNDNDDHNNDDNVHLSLLFLAPQWMCVSACERLCLHGGEQTSGWSQTHLTDYWLPKPACCSISLWKTVSESQNVFCKTRLNVKHQCSATARLLCLNESKGLDFNAIKSELWRQSFWFLDTSPLQYFLPQIEKNKMKQRHSFVIISLCLLLSGNTHQHPDPGGKHPLTTAWVTKVWFTCTELLQEPEAVYPASAGNTEHAKFGEVWRRTVGE